VVGRTFRYANQLTIVGPVNADGNNAIVFGDVDPDDLYLDSKDRRLEGQREVLFEHGEEPGRVL
jgi:hypothetical protein